MLLFSCSNDSGPGYAELGSKEAQAIADELNTAELIQEAVGEESDETITVTFSSLAESRAAANAVQIATVEFNGYRYNGIEITEGTLEYTFYGSTWISNYTVETAEMLLFSYNGTARIPLEITLDGEGGLANGYISGASERPSSFEIRSVPSNSCTVTIAGHQVEIDGISYIPPATYHNVTFSANIPAGYENQNISIRDGSIPSSQSVRDGGYATEPDDPILESIIDEGVYWGTFKFLGWYLDPDSEEPFDFENTPIESFITLYAKWDMEKGGTWYMGTDSSTVLSKMRDSLSEDSTLNITLVDDITLEGEWIPLCATIDGYNGTFDGNGHTIRVDEIDVATYGFNGYAGFIARLGSNGVVKNLRIEIADGINIDSTSDLSSIRSLHVGGIVGENVGGEITNCSTSVTISINAPVSSVDAGGIVGYNGSGDIIGCYSTGSVSSVDGSYVGGVCGTNPRGTITACYSTGLVSGGSGSRVGGVCGDNSGTITACYSIGSVSGGSGSRVGGVCGDNSRTITACYSIGSVSGGDGSNVGGICGYSSNETLTACYSTGLVSGGSRSYVGGVCGYSTGITIAACYWSVPDDEEAEDGYTKASSGIGYDMMHNTAAEISEDQGWISNMNTAIDNSDSDCDYRYEASLENENEPAILVAIDSME